MLDVKELLAKLLRAPMVIEQGTSGIWTYRKWSDGKAECWGQKTWNVTGYSAWGSSYYSNYSGATAYPNNLFIDTPVELANYSHNTANSGDGVLGLRIAGNTATQTANYYILRPNNGSAGTATVSIHAIGKWK